MIPAEFAYTRAASLDEALALLAKDADAKVIAGGQSLIPLMKLRLARPERLVDIGRLKELKGISVLPDGRIAVGALTTYRQLLDAKEAAHFGVLRDSIPRIADVQVRNLGTVGGAVSHVDPASDLAAVLLALDAEVVARSSKGERRIALRDFMVGPFTSSLGQGELVTQVVLPKPLGNAGSAYAALEQKASGYAIAGAAAVVVVGPDGTIVHAGVALTGVGEIPYRASAVEAALVGKKASAEAIAAAAGHATDGQAVNSDIHADADYRAAMAVVQVRRALEAAAARI